MEPGGIRFELARLPEHDEASLIAELQRVAALTADDEPLTTALFNRNAKVHSSTVVRRLGGWRTALDTAGLVHRYSGRPVSDKMKSQVAKRMSTPQLVAELRRVADALGSDTLTQPQFNAHSSLSASAVSRRLGSWKAALHAAGLKPVVMGRRYSEEDFFENLLAVWTHYGRQPKYREMDQPPSKITAGGYECRFGGWTKALIAFVEYANANSSVEVEDPAARPPANDAPSNGPAVVTRSQRSIPLGLRYDVLRRDNFKCVICGRSPATDPKCTLHVDHIVPVSKDGTAASDNLRTLCADCNLGKSAKLEAVQQWLPADAASRRS